VKIDEAIRLVEARISKTGEVASIGVRGLWSDRLQQRRLSASWYISSGQSGGVHGSRTFHGSRTRSFGSASGSQCPRTAQGCPGDACGEVAEIIKSFCRGEAGLGEATRRATWPGMADHGEAGEARSGKAWSGRAQFGTAMQARQGLARCGLIRRGKTWQARQSATRHGPARRGRA